MFYKKLTTEDFIEKAKAIHGDFYDYSETKYFGSLAKLNIICKTHGSFEQVASTHLNGSGCVKCAIANRTKKLTTFIKEANLKYKNKFSYKNFIYITSHTKGIIICNNMHTFKQSPSQHLQGTGCPKCNIQKRAKNDVKSTEYFIHKAKLRHGNTYNYDCSEYKDTETKIKIKCKKHGIFEQSPHNHYAGYGCPICKSSHGELLIQKFLEQESISYKNNYIIEKCKNKKPLPFDFAIFNENNLLFLIEYQGRQHYSASSFGSKTTSAEKILEDIKTRDKIKQKYCKQNHIPLLLIPYWKQSKIETLIISFIKGHK
jgi:hypothetical protein